MLEGLTELRKPGGGAGVKLTCLVNEASELSLQFETKNK